MSTHPAFRRRQLVVRPGFQIRFIGLLLLEMGVIVGILAIVTQGHVARLQNIIARISPASSPGMATIRDQLEASVRQFYSWSLVLGASTLVVLVLCGLLASHKLAGPVYKLTRFFKAVGTGDDERRIAFRKKDRLGAFAASINTAIESVAERRRAVSAALGTLGQRAEHLRGVETADEAQRTIEEMEALVSRLRTSVEVEGHS